MSSSETAPFPRPAWQPLTIDGVARFGFASWSRLLGMAVIVAMIGAASCGLFCRIALFPSIQEAINRLPAESSIEQGELRWPAGANERLTDTHLLTITVHPEDGPLLRSSSDFQVEFQKHALKFSSLFGYSTLPYPTGWILSLNRNALGPSWGAWRPLILGGICLLFGLFLFCSWTGLATLYFWIPRTISFYLDKPLGTLGAWKTAFASLMPGALLLSVSLILYGLGRISLILWLILFGVHFVVGWVYVTAAAFFIPSEKPPANPFESETPEEDRNEEDNPFRE